MRPLMRGSFLCTEWPLMVTWPVLGFRLPLMTLSNVDLPDPLPPIMATSLPASSWKEIWRRPMVLFLKT